MSYGQERRQTDNDRAAHLGPVRAAPGPGLRGGSAVQRRYAGVRSGGTQVDPVAARRRGDAHRATLASGPLAPDPFDMSALASESSVQPAVGPDVVQRKNADGLGAVQGPALDPADRGQILRNGGQLQEADKPAEERTGNAPDAGGDATLPPLRVKPEVIDCGALYAGGTAHTAFTIAGAFGSAQAHIEAMPGLPAAEARAFSVQQDLPVPFAGVDFAPPTQGSYKAVLRAQAEDGRETVALLKGIGEQATADACGTEGLTVRGHEQTLTSENPRATVTVDNGCVGSLALSSVLAVSGDAADFEVFPPSLPTTLEPGQSVELVVEFKAVSAQPRSEMTYVLGTSTDGVSTEFSVRGERENFLDADARGRIEALASNNLGSARGAFGRACNRVIEDLREESQDLGFAGVLVDLVLGLLVPGLGKALLGEVVKLLPPTEFSTRLGSAILDYQDQALAKVVGPAGESVKSALRGSAEMSILDTLDDEVSLKMTEMQNGISGYSDTELLALSTLYHPSVAKKTVYMAEIHKYVGQFRTQVKPIGDKKHHLEGRYIQPGHLELGLAWIQASDGTEYLAQGWQPVAALSSARSGLGFQFRTWVSRQMKDIALSRDSGPPTIGEQDAKIKPSDWLGRLGAATAGA